jgi:hypothetical protein
MSALTVYSERERERCLFELEEHGPSDAGLDEDGSHFEQAKLLEHGLQI